MKHPSPTNIRLDWKGLPGSNALAYYEKPQLTAVKSFITLATDRSGRHFQKFRSSEIDATGERRR